MQIAVYVLDHPYLKTHVSSLPQDYLNVRGHVRANGVPGGLTAVVIVMVTAQIH